MFGVGNALEWAELFNTRGSRVPAPPLPNSATLRFPDDDTDTAGGHCFKALLFSKKMAVSIVILVFGIFFFGDKVYRRLRFAGQPLVTRTRANLRCASAWFSSAYRPLFKLNDSFKRVENKTRQTQIQYRQKNSLTILALSIYPNLIH